MAMAVESIDAELRLGLPGSAGGGGGDGAAAKKRRSESTVKSEASGTACGGGPRDADDGASPSSKVQVVGWPPVGSYRRSTFQSSLLTTAAAAAKGKGGGETDQGRKKKVMTGGGGLYVKVSMDGAPYLRKVDLRMYGGYRELRDALDALFGYFCSPAADAAGHFAVAYEDKDGDLMLAGDVPWDMFISSCKKLRIMRGSEAR